MSTTETETVYTCGECGLTGDADAIGEHAVEAHGPPYDYIEPQLPTTETTLAEGRHEPDWLHHGCPECGLWDGSLYISRGEWAYCLEHRTMWMDGSNLTSGWRKQTEDEQRAIYDGLGLSEFRHVEGAERERGARIALDRILDGDEPLTLYQHAFLSNYGRRELGGEDARLQRALARPVAVEPVDADPIIPF
jgi:hypothetical protein